MFAPPVSVIKHKPQHSDPNTHDAWYAWFSEGKGDTITVQYIYHPCLIENHNKQRVNVYYMKLNCRDGSCENAAGTSLTLPVTKEAADRLTSCCSSLQLAGWLGPAVGHNHDAALSKG
jgi:hypothetical protein